MMCSLPLMAVLVLSLHVLRLHSQQDPTLCRNLTAQAPGRSSSASGSTTTSDQLCQDMFCDEDSVAKLDMENLSYAGGVSQLTVTVTQNQNQTEGNSSFYYVLCSYFVSDFQYGNLIGCGASDDVYSVEHMWQQDGIATVGAVISYGNGTEFACANNSAIIAKNGYFNVTVCIEQGVPASPIQPVQPCNQPRQYMVGNLSFIPFPNATGLDNITTFKYDFGDQSDVVTNTGPYVTHEYKSDGYFDVTVDAFVKVFVDTWRYHAQFRRRIRVLEQVKNVSIAVSKDNSVQVGSTRNITISARGSIPISVCWYVLNQTTEAPSSVHPIETCVSISDSSLATPTTLHEMVFNQTGKFTFVAVFQNNVSSVNATFNFTVYGGPSPPVVPVASGAVVALAVLIVVVVIVIMLIMGFILPYRRYKRRMTETANFRFVDLTESGSHRWERFKATVSSFRYRSSDKMKSPLANFDERSPLMGSRHEYSHDEDL